MTCAWSLGVVQTSLVYHDVATRLKLPYCFADGRSWLTGRQAERERAALGAPCVLAPPPSLMRSSSLPFLSFSLSEPPRLTKPQDLRWCGMYNPLSAQLHQHYCHPGYPWYGDSGWARPRRQRRCRMVGGGRRRCLFSKFSREARDRTAGKLGYGIRDPDRPPHVVCLHCAGGGGEEHVG